MPLDADPAVRAHQTWLGYLQPDGLVVSPAALVDSQVVLETRAIESQQRFQNFVEAVPLDDDEVLVIENVQGFCAEFLEWPAECLWGFHGERPVPDALRVALPELGEVLQPSFALRALHPGEKQREWILAGQILPRGTDLDAVTAGDKTGWSASPTRRFERLLRAIEVPVGLLFNGPQIRMVYAPRGENSGSLTFPIRAMAEVAGRPILSALSLLLEKYRLFAAPSEARLEALLVKSREYQSTVSTALAQQVLAALYELLRGFQAANEYSRGELLSTVLEQKPDDVYAGLLTVLMRLVFLLYAEDRGVMPGGSLYVQNYSVHALFERLRLDAERYPDTIDHRYGAWARLVALFRAVYAGCPHPQLRMPAREGYLFDPERFPFLEGLLRTQRELPLVSDGVIHRVLEKLLMLRGERLSYRTLDVEQIGSVYETMMGFRLRITRGPCIAIKAPKAHGAPMPLELEDLLAQPAEKRAEWFAQQTGQKLTAKVLEGLKQAESVNEAVAALDKKIARLATPHVVPAGSMVLEPSDERRRSGSHYTPRSLTEPIVRRALEPVLERLGKNPTPEAILALKVCDPAVGSGAFLVEACRQLADALVRSWHAHKAVPTIPPDEDEILHARRLVAQRCLYGVDRNPMAADLAKLSLWLVTLARDHPFTFLNHAIRPGDSLVDLGQKELERFHWTADGPVTVFTAHVWGVVHEAEARRVALEELGDTDDQDARRQLLAQAEELIGRVKSAGDAVIGAFFGAETGKARARLRDELAPMAQELLASGQACAKLEQVLRSLRSGDHPVLPFHWEMEFPEVFSRERPGFDVVVGNPPFLGGKRISTAYSESYRDWLAAIHARASSNADLVAHFYRRAFGILREGGTFGLIATNTISQGDTRASGLTWICTHRGEIYEACRRLRWPGQAAVVVSVVHVAKGWCPSQRVLDRRPADSITAYLFHRGGHEDPKPLAGNGDQSFIGCFIYGMGFTFDDDNPEATPIAEMQRLIARNPKNRERIFPYIGGDEVNDSPTHAHRRYVINFGNLCEEDARRWPDLVRILEEKVKPDRETKAKDVAAWPWWQFWRSRPELQLAVQGVDRVLVCCRHQPHWTITFVSASSVMAESLVVFVFHQSAALAVLQSRVHEVWARFFASSLEDRLRYTPDDCFRTFPFPPGWVLSSPLETAGRAYYDHRAGLMVANNEGLTTTYNRFHDPDERDLGILKLRDLHAAMDRAVLDAYGWTDISPTCEFLLDYEDNEDDDDSDGRVRKRKKPWRYRWPDEVRDEVLGRLLALNEERAREEALRGPATLGPKPTRVKRGRARRK